MAAADTKALRFVFCFVIVLLCSALPETHAQAKVVQPKFVPLPGSRNYDDIRTILEDSKGFLWFGSSQGLVRFDGNTYHRYEPGITTNTIASDAITALHEDNNGIVWIGTADKGLYSYDYNADTFSIHPLPGALLFINSIDTWGDQIVVSAGKAVCTIAKNGLVRQLAVPAGMFLNNSIIVKTAADVKRKNVLWILSSSGLYSYDTVTRLVKKWHDNGYSTDEVGNTLAILVPGSSDRIYSAVKNKGLVELDVVTGKVSQHVFSKNSTTAYSANNIDALLSYDDNHLFAATQDSGVAVFDVQSSRFRFLQQENFLETGTYRFQAKAFSASNKNIVMATQHDGIWVFNKVSSLFQSTTMPSAYNKVPGTLYARSVYPAADGNVYAGSYFGDGLYVFNSNGTVETFPFLTAEGKGQTLIVNGIFRDHNNTTWLASHENGVLIFDEASKKIVPAAALFPVLKEAAAKKIYCFHEDKQNNLYIATGDTGLVMLDAARQAIKHYRHNEKDSNSILTNHLFAEKIFEDNNGQLWLSTRQGITVLETATQKFHHFTNQPGKYNSVPPAFWYSFQQDDKGFIYIGTGEGMYKINSNDRTFAKAVHFSAKEGLQHDNVFSFVKDKQGMIWITCRTGLSCFNPASGRFTNFSYKNGLPSKTLMAPMQPAADGKIYHGAVEKYFCFDPVALRSNMDTAKVWLTAFKIFDKDSINGFRLNNTKSIQVFYNQNSFSFSFVSPAVYYPDAVTYAYMLEGFDKQWQYPGSRSYVSYTNVAPGTYTFKVKAAGANGVWSDGATSVKIIVKPPYWATWWFRLIVLLIIGSIVYAFIRYKERIIAAREAEKTEMEKIKVLGYQYQLEIEQVTGFFSSAISRQNSIDDMLWDIAKNLIGKMGFEECMIYLWNNDKTMLMQHAGYGLKGDMQVQKNKEAYHMPRGKGIVGTAAATGEYILVNDTSKDSRYYSADEKIMFSELAVPIVQHGDVMGVINTEHCKKNFFKEKHVKILTVIASLCADKMETIQAEKQTREKEMEVLQLNKDLADWQITALRAQMNPHFIFNAMNSIQQFTLKNETDAANLYISKFSLLLRKVLHTSQQQFISLEEEAEQLTLYLEIEKLRMGTDFYFDITIEEEIEADAVQLPGMLVQPFVENAVKHGLPLKAGEKKLCIHFSMPDDFHLQAVVTDNGIGRRRAAEIREQQTLLRHESKGIALVQQRLQLLQQGNQHHANVFIDDLPNDGGTRVTILIPIL